MLTVLHLPLQHAFARSTALLLLPLRCSGKRQRFNPRTHEDLLPLLVKGHQRVVVTCLSPSKLNNLWRGAGDSADAFKELGCRIKVETDGNQSFRVYAYRTQDPSHLVLLRQPRSGAALLVRAFEEHHAGRSVAGAERTDQLT